MTISKNLLFWLGLICLSSSVLTACQDSSATKNDKAPQNIEADSANYTTIHWIDSLKDFGTIAFGEKAKIVYQFENTGSKPLYLTSVRPTCGCTIADYTHVAVLPGDKGKVEAEFDSNHGGPGTIHKSIVVTSNTTNDKNFVLAFTGTVTKK